ncbi:MAG: PadR family transcriptional regulator [Tissierellales bacterium]|nr:PadR family transcriptional regulator [Tissierellales bacterium]
MNEKHSNSNLRQRQFPSTISTTSFAKLYILHILSVKKCYGNYIKEEIGRRLKGKWIPSPGLIYPLLNQLEQEGLIVGNWEEPIKRTVKIYTITEYGMEHYNYIKKQYLDSILDSYDIIKFTLKDIYSLDDV